MFKNQRTYNKQTLFYMHKNFYFNVECLWTMESSPCVLDEIKHEKINVWHARTID